MSENNFGVSRNKFRRVYNYGQSGRPEIRVFIDTLTDTTRSLDFQRMIRDRDYFLINSNVELIFPPPDPAPVEYLEVTVAFSEGTSVDLTFPEPFTGTPFLGFETVQDNTGSTGGPNVAWWVTNLSTAGFTANFSSEFVGTITYRAVYTPATYPAFVERVPDLPGQYGWVSAAAHTASYQSGITMSFDALPSLPEYVNYNPVGLNSDTSLDIGQTIWTVSSSFVTNELSTEFIGTLHVVALDTDPGDTVPFEGNPE